MSALSIRGLRARLDGEPKIVSYAAVEAYAQQLAAQLTAAFSLENLRKCYFMAIPRGGHFVLGMLAYILDLPHEALKPPPQDSSAPLIIVDDCVLSGNRFGRFINQYPDNQIIFAHLCSHPAVREAIVSTEPQVTACLAAFDLKDLAEERFPDPDDHKAWQKKWYERAVGKVYWIGLPELVVFPWNEPDRVAWNSETEQIEDNWRLASPDRCLKNWGKLGVPPRQGTRASFRIPDDVAYTIHQDDVSLYNMTDDTMYGLNGSSADIWRGLAAYGDLSATRDHMLELYDVDPERLTADIQSLVDTLLAKGLLEPVNDSPAT